MSAIERVLLWQRLDGPGHEVASLRRDGDGWLLEGVALALEDDAPLRVVYSVSCDAGWATRHVHVQLLHGSREAGLTLLADGRGGWVVDGAERSDLAGCIDVDLGVSPVTNTLPIRRLDLAIGEARDLAAAWVRFPSLEVRVLRQRYTRLSEHVYRYESAGGFSAELDVDDAGLVAHYPGGWEVVVSHPAAGGA